MLLQDRLVFITGAARGIGAATARRVVAEGGRVVIADRRLDESEVVAAELNAMKPGAAMALELDIVDEAQWTRAIAAAESAIGPIRALVNAAGIIRVAPLEKLDVETFRKVVDINLVGTFIGMKAISEPMKRNGGGSIINFSSVQGLEGRQGFLAYSASKFGIRALTKTGAIELGQYGIRVNTVLPGPTRTKMTERPGWTDEDYNRAYGKYPLGRMAEAVEIAEMVVFLASDKSSYCTGGDFVVDGGLSVGKPRD